LVENRRFNLPQLYLAPPSGVTALEFRRDLWHQKTTLCLKKGPAFTTCYNVYSAPQCSHCNRCTSYGISVRLSVRLSDTGIVSKRRLV